MPSPTVQYSTVQQGTKIIVALFEFSGLAEVYTYYFLPLQKEGTVLLLADILCACYGWEPVPPVVEPPPATVATPARVDPSYVNNPSLADVTFRFVYLAFLCNSDRTISFCIK